MNADIPTHFMIVVIPCLCFVYLPIYCLCRKGNRLKDDVFLHVCITTVFCLMIKLATKTKKFQVEYDSDFLCNNITLLKMCISICKLSNGIHFHPIHWSYFGHSFDWIVFTFCRDKINRPFFVEFIHTQKNAQLKIPREKDIAKCSFHSHFMSIMKESIKKNWKPLNDMTKLLWLHQIMHIMYCPSQEKKLYISHWLFYLCDGS